MIMNKSTIKYFNLKPKKKSEWFQFCFGKPLKKSLKEPIKEEKTAHKPLLSIMYKMNQVNYSGLITN